MVELLDILFWFCCNKFAGGGKFCVMGELLKYSGMLLKSGTSIVFSNMHKKMSRVQFEVNNLWDIAYVNRLQRDQVKSLVLQTGGNSILLAI